MCREEAAGVAAGSHGVWADVVLPWWGGPAGRGCLYVHENHEGSCVERGGGGGGEKGGTAGWESGGRRPASVGTQGWEPEQARQGEDGSLRVGASARGSSMPPVHRSLLLTPFTTAVDQVVAVLAAAGRRGARAGNPGDDHPSTICATASAHPYSTWLSGCSRVPCCPQRSSAAGVAPPPAVAPVLAAAAVGDAGLAAVLAVGALQVGGEAEAEALHGMDVINACSAVPLVLAPVATCAAGARQGGGGRRSGARGKQECKDGHTNDGVALARM